MITNTLKFVHKSRVVEIDFEKVNYRPSTTVLNYLRMQSDLRGTKEGCAEGDCGACTVVIGEAGSDNHIYYKAVDSCMLFLPALHGKLLITVEDLATYNGVETILHPVQKAMVDEHGSQCGFCTPGIVMSLFAFFKSDLAPSRENIVYALSGNLCRCTGYEPIINAVKLACSMRQHDKFDEKETELVKLLKSIDWKRHTLTIETPLQQYFMPSTLAQTVELRSSKPDAQIINGSTDTAIRQNKTHEYLPKIIDISAVDELKTIREIESGYYIGSGVSIEKLKEWSLNKIPHLLPILNVFASLQIRSVATIGGNLCTASPIGDLIPMMFALRARFEIIGKNGNRWVDAENFFIGYRKNCLQPDELLKGIEIPTIPEGVVVKSEKVSNRRDLDISTVSLAARLEIDSKNIVNEVILAFGGLAEVTKRARNVENFLLGEEWTREVVEAAIKLIHNDFTPISDARSSKEYRIIVAGNLLLKIQNEH
jgi:xanthine dehydrogenase small subunit